MKKAYSMHVGSLLLFGANGIVASYIALSSYEIVLFRTLIGFVFMLLLFLITGGRFDFFRHKRDMLCLLVSGVAMGTSWMFLYEGFHQIGVSLSTLLYYCGPVIVMVLSPLVFKEKLTWIKLVGFAVVLCGLFMINGEVAVAGGSKWGLACAILSAVTYSFMVMFNKKARHVIGLQKTVLQLVIAFVTVAVFVICKQGFAIRVVSQDWLPILALGIVHTAIGCYLYFSTLTSLPIQSVALCGYLEPLSAVLFSAMFLQERLTPLQIVGAVCILGGACFGECVKAKTCHKEERV